MKLVVYISIFFLFMRCNNRNTITYAIDLDKTPVEDSLLNEAKRYSVRLNRYRLDNHIPILPDSFVLNRYGLDYVSWQNSNPQKKPVYHNKLITWSIDSLLNERNVFTGPKDERLIIWYGQEVDTNMNPIRAGYHFSCSFRQIEKDSSTSKDVTIEQADSILQSWGLSAH